MGNQTFTLNGSISLRDNNNAPLSLEALMSAIEQAMSGPMNVPFYASVVAVGDVLNFTWTVTEAVSLPVPIPSPDPVPDGTPEGSDDGGS
jgi:hypothetical protein